jgi:hypothetical protein
MGSSLNILVTLGDIILRDHLIMLSLETMKEPSPISAGNPHDSSNGMESKTSVLTRSDQSSDSPVV